MPSTSGSAASLLSPLEDEHAGEVLLPESHADIPPERVTQGQASAARGLHRRRFPLADGRVRPPTTPAEQLLIAPGGRRWSHRRRRPPADRDAGNVLRATPLKLSVRLPPTCDARRDGGRSRRSPPTRPTAHLVDGSEGTGWNAPDRALAGRRRSSGVAGSVRPAPARCRRGRHHPVHGHARRAFPSRVPRPRRDGSRFERPRTQRVPPPPDRPARHDGCGACSMPTLGASDDVAAARRRAILTTCGSWRALSRLRR